MLSAVALAAVPAPAAAQRIVAVGDLHGDYNVWLDIARNAGLIDAKNHWSGGKTILVQQGDVFDRGPDSLKIARHLKSLQKEAPKAGGKVIALLGNHEGLGDFAGNQPADQRVPILLVIALDLHRRITGTAGRVEEVAHTSFGLHC